MIVEAAPSRDAMKITGALNLGQRIKFVPCEFEWRLDQSVNPKIPGFRIEVRHRTIMQDWPFQSEGLSRRQAPRGFHRLLQFSAIFAFKQHGGFLGPVFYIDRRQFTFYSYLS